jgi:hypothetical protein
MQLMGSEVSPSARAGCMLSDEQHKKPTVIATPTHTLMLMDILSVSLSIHGRICQMAGSNEIMKYRLGCQGPAAPPSAVMKHYSSMAASHTCITRCAVCMWQVILTVVNIKHTFDIQVHMPTCKLNIYVIAYAIK